MESINKGEEIKYTPDSLLNIFNNSLRINEEKKIIKIEGVYLQQKSKEYGNVYYDKVKDYNLDKFITVMIPKKIRESLKDNYIYTFDGYVNKKITNNGSIQINFCVTNVLKDSEKINHEYEKLSNSVKHKKELKEFKNFKLSIESKLMEGYKPKIALILGNTAIIKDDIFNALDNKNEFFTIKEYRINLSSKEEIINNVKNIDMRNYDALVISRGGGTGLEIFNDIEVVECLSSIKTILVTAIGHALDFTYLQSIADYSFDTPTALGNYLKGASEKVLNIYKNVNSEIDVLKNQMNDYMKKNNELLQEVERLNNKKDIEISNIKKQQYIKLGIVIIVFIIILVFQKM